MKKTILELLSSIRPESKFEASEDFHAEGLLDSFDMAVLVSTLDSTFDIAIEGVDIVPENFKNLNSIEELLRKKGVQQ